ncbi:MAG: type II toxin-antitoxin system VapC family toxin [Verrucomicrobiota bacterium]
MQTVYVETTIPSYLAAYESSQEPMASHQRLTQDWWKNDRHRFLLYSSVFVRQEASCGDSGAAQRRLQFLHGLPELDVPEALDDLEAELIRLFQLPPRAATDASHLGMAILHRIDYLLTWNCTHLANATLQKDLHQYCQYHSLHYPIVCTPETLTRTQP